MRILIDTDAGNCTVKDGSINRIMRESLERLSAEAAYFYADDGMRAGLIVFDLQDPSELPRVTEPFMHELCAKVWVTPVMSADDLRKGLQEAFAVASG